MYDILESPSPLPHGITIRTPSPVEGLSTATARAPQLTGEVLLQHFDHAEDVIPRLHPTIGDANDTSGSLACYAVSVYQGCATTIPWVALYQALQCKRINDPFQAMKSILTPTDILQTSSRTFCRLGGLMMTCCRRSKIFSPQSSLTVSNKFVLVN